MGKNSLNSITLSIVVPLLNEEGNVQHLIEKLETVLENIKESYEIILVDDGSNDSTWERIQSAAQKNKRIKGISLSRIFGHLHALLAGLEHSKGMAILSMDGDLQHPTEIINEMFTKWNEGYEIVNTSRDDMDVSPFSPVLKNSIQHNFFYSRSY